MNTVEKKKYRLFFYFKFGKIWQEFLRQKERYKNFSGRERNVDTGCTLYIKLMLIRNSDILGSFGLFCLLCGFRQLGNLFGTDGNGFRIGGGLLSFALGGFFVFFFGLFTVLGLTVRVSVFGVTVLGIAIFVSVFGTAVGFTLAVCLF